MKAIFLLNNKANVDYVYSKESQERLKKLVGIDMNDIYCQEDLENNPEKFKDVEYIFSTWSMPGGSEPKDDFGRFMPNAKALFYAAGSVRYFAESYFKRNVRVFSAYAANAIPVAEYTVGQILLANKGFYQSSILAKAGKYDEAHKLSLAHAGNYDAKIGIIGAGMIGRKVIELLKPYRLNILVYDIFMSEEKAKELGVTKVDLETLFSECDVVSNHLANVPATVGILTEQLFAKMKPNSTFINTGRGQQTDEDGMLRVFKDRQDICALLDVTIDEPPKENSVLYTLPNVFLTPHIAGSQSNEVQRMSELIVDELERYLNGEECLYELTPEKLKNMA
ncbi:MAG: hydroxyacid dehydrogenase [Clostridia bacterium]|nr:hydroxyacid dehydrogenase [Clostridia bacterium]